MPDVLETNETCHTDKTIKASAGPCDCSRPVDLVHLARYTMGDRTLEREVLELFRSHSTGQLDRLVAAIGDPQKWRDAAHTIKGSARGIGAWKLAAAAEEAEVSASAPKASCESMVEKVRRMMLETNSYIETLFAGV